MLKFWDRGYSGSSQYIYIYLFVSLSPLSISLFSTVCLPFLINVLPHKLHELHYFVEIFNFHSHFPAIITILSVQGCGGDDREGAGDVAHGCTRAWVLSRDLIKVGTEMCKLFLQRLPAHIHTHMYAMHGCMLLHAWAESQGPYPHRLFRNCQRCE